MKKRRGRVYFIQQGVNGPIKIGVTSGPPLMRVRELQVYCTENLYLIGWILGVESEIHDRFAKYRISGEWFRPHKSIVRFACLNTPPLKPIRYQDKVTYSGELRNLRPLLEKERRKLIKESGVRGVSMNSTIQSVLRRYFEIAKKRRRAT